MTQEEEFAIYEQKYKKSSARVPVSRVPSARAKVATAASTAAAVTGGDDTTPTAATTTPTRTVAGAAAPRRPLSSGSAPRASAATADPYSVPSSVTRPMQRLSLSELPSESSPVSRGRSVPRPAVQAVATSGEEMDGEIVLGDATPFDLMRRYVLVCVSCCSRSGSVFRSGGALLFIGYFFRIVLPFLSVL